MAKRKTTRARATRKPATSPRPRAGATTAALPGRGPRAKEMTLELGPQADAAARTTEERRESRPYTSRYPIADEQFRQLKEAAVKAKVAKGDATAAADSGGKLEVSATGAAVAAVDPSLEPSAAPTAATNFSGIAATGWIPPDCTMAVGPAHVMLSVNSSVAIHNKVGGAPVLQRTLTQWFANVVTGQTVFDPKLLYDQHAARWVLLAVAFKTNPNTSVFLLSVSATSNPLGVWRNYSLDATKDGVTPTGNWADFPALGVDASALYLTANMFAFGGGFQYAKIRVVPKAGPYCGGAATYFDFVKMKNPDNTMAFTIQPCHTFGAPQVEYLVNSRFPSGNALTLWRIANPRGRATVDADRPCRPLRLCAAAQRRSEGRRGRRSTPATCAFCEAAFRGDSVWCALTTSRNWGLGNRASVHWFQIRAAANALVQEGVYGTRAAHYFYPAGCPDANGNFVLVFSRSGTGEFGSIGYTGRQVDRPSRNAAGERAAEGGRRALSGARQLGPQPVGRLQRRGRGSREPAAGLVLQRVLQRGEHLGDLGGFGVLLIRGPLDVAGRGDGTVSAPIPRNDVSTGEAHGFHRTALRRGSGWRLGALEALYFLVITLAVTGLAWWRRTMPTRR